MGIVYPAYYIGKIVNNKNGVEYPILLDFNTFELCMESDLPRDVSFINSLNNNTNYDKINNFGELAYLGGGQFKIPEHNKVGNEFLVLGTFGDKYVLLCPGIHNEYSSAIKSGTVPKEKLFIGFKMLKHQFGSLIIVSKKTAVWMKHKLNISYRNATATTLYCDNPKLKYTGNSTGEFPNIARYLIESNLVNPYRILDIAISSLVSGKQVEKSKQENEEKDKLYKVYSVLKTEDLMGNVYWGREILRLAMSTNSNDNIYNLRSLLKSKESAGKNIEADRERMLQEQAKLKEEQLRRELKYKTIINFDIDSLASEYITGIKNGMKASSFNTRALVKVDSNNYTMKIIKLGHTLNINIKFELEDNNNILSITVSSVDDGYNLSTCSKYNRNIEIFHDMEYKGLVDTTIFNSKLHEMLFSANKRLG